MLKPPKQVPIPEDTLQIGEEIVEPENVMRKMGTILWNSERWRKKGY